MTEVRTEPNLKFCHIVPELNNGAKIVFASRQEKPRALPQFLQEVFTGDYLIWPDSDDELMNDSISERVAYMEAHKEIALLITNFVSSGGRTEKVVCNYRRILGRMNPETFERCARSWEGFRRTSGLYGPWSRRAG